MKITNNTQKLKIGSQIGNSNGLSSTIFIIPLAYFDIDNRCIRLLLRKDIGGKAGDRNPVPRAYSSCAFGGPGAIYI